MKLPYSEPFFFKRQWNSEKAGKKTRWVVRWSNGMKRNGRAVNKERGGFPTKEAARAFYYKYVVPALEAGYSTPWEMEEANQKTEVPEQTVGEWFTKHMKRPIHYKNDESFRTTLSTYRTAILFWGENRKLSSLRREDMEAFAMSNTQTGMPKADTVRGRFLRVRACLQRAVEDGIILRNPCAGIKVPKAGKGRLRYLTLAESRRLLEECLKLKVRHGAETPAHLIHAQTATALYSGQRLDEIQHLEWTDINWDIQRITIQSKPHMNWSPKSGRPRTVGVNADLLRILENYRKMQQESVTQAAAAVAELESWIRRPEQNREPSVRPSALKKYKQPPSASALLAKARNVLAVLEAQSKSNLVFPGPTGEAMTVLPKGFEEAVEAAGLKTTGVSFHTLRHTFASHLVMAGCDLPSLKELMGHRDIETTMRYAHLAPDSHVQKGALMPTI